jgi:hypothetical protein
MSKRLQLSKRKARRAEAAPAAKDTRLVPIHLFLEQPRGEILVEEQLHSGGTESGLRSRSAAKARQAPRHSQMMLMSFSTCRNSGSPV